MLIDTHCHLDYLQNQNKRSIQDVILEAYKHGVKHIISIATNLKRFPDILCIANNNCNIWCSIGVHPLTIDSQEENIPDIRILLDYAKYKKVVGLGETGLDYYRNPQNKKKQQESFLVHIQAAQKTNLPIIVHTRNASNDTLAVLKESYKQNSYSGIIHSFTESYDFAKSILDMGFMISISGIITFKSAITLQDTIKKLPIESIIIETDSPYLTPVPYRGHTNEPKYLIYTAKCISELKSIEYESCIQQFCINTKKIFQKLDY